MGSDLDMKMEKSTKVEPGMYKAIVKSIERKAGKHGDYLRWMFEVVDDEEFEGETVSGITNGKITDKSAIYRWAKAILGLDEVAVGETIKISRCIGKECRISVDEKPDKNDSSKTFTNVDKVLPSKGGKKKDEDEEEDTPKKKKHSEDEEENEPKKKKHRDEDEEDDEEEKPKKKKHVEEDDEDERPKKKKKSSDDEEDDDIPF